MSSSTTKNINVIIPQRAPLLGSGRELIGILEIIGEEPEDGLIWLRVAGQERRVPEEMGAKLRPLLDAKISLLRIGERWSLKELD